ncbi:MAG: VPLPA-CTERM sorting domain-containing protein [Pseudomonadota bacterium]
MFGMSLGAAQAATLPYEVFLISEQAAPLGNSVPEFTVSTTSVYKLGGFDSNLKATEATKVDNFDFRVKEALEYKNAASNINRHEGVSSSNMEARVNSELNMWDDVGVVADGRPDAPKNVDFSDGSWLSLKGLQTGFTDLIIGEDAGLDPFKLVLCPHNQTCHKVFGGLSNSLLSSLGDQDDFSLRDTSDASNMDQAFLFRFAEPIFHHVGIVESKNGHDRSALLEIDFVGVGHITPVPVPAGLPLILTAAGAFAWLRRRQKS